ncbi:MAG: thioesterase family protein [Pseudomonadota bacterium]
MWFETETALLSAQTPETGRGSQQGRWHGTVFPQWRIGDNPHGGYLAALALRALQSLCPEQPDPLSCTVHFLRPGIAGAPCEVQANIIKPGRLASVGRATLIQDSKPRLEVLAAMGQLPSPDDAGAQPPPTLTLTPPELPPPEDCPMRSAAAQGVALPLLERLDIRLHPDQAAAGAAGAAVVSGWISLRDGAPTDSLAALVFADAFPPSVFGLLGEVGWVPTLELTVQLRAAPTGTWLRGAFETRDLAGSQMIEDGALWDSSGRLIAQSRQLALVMRS